MVETFENLSGLSDMMAAKLRLVSEQLQATKANEKALAESLKRVEVQVRDGRAGYVGVIRGSVCCPPFESLFLWQLPPSRCMWG